MTPASICWLVITVRAPAQSQGHIAHPIVLHGPTIETFSRHADYRNCQSYSSVSSILFEQRVRCAMQKHQSFASYGSEGTQLHDLPWYLTGIICCGLAGSSCLRGWQIQFLTVMWTTRNFLCSKLLERRMLQSASSWVYFPLMRSQMAQFNDIPTSLSTPGALRCQALHDMLEQHTVLLKKLSAMFVH